MVSIKAVRVWGERKNNLAVITFLKSLTTFAGSAIIFFSSSSTIASPPLRCVRTITADVVAIEQPIMFNRLGAQNINGMIYALNRDVVTDSATPAPIPKSLTFEQAKKLAGHVYLRPDKRPRPLVLRVAAGDCLDVTLANLLNETSNPNDRPLTPPTAIHVNTVGGGEVPTFNNQASPGGEKPFKAADDQVADRMVGFHVQGMQVRDDIGGDSSYVGENSNSLVKPGNSKTYHLIAGEEGTFLVTSHGATFGSDGTAGNSANGLFGAVNVEPAGAKFYRSQVTEEEMRLATTGTTSAGQPIINYDALYPAIQPWISEGKAGLPILNMLKGTELVHTDINAVIAGPNPDGMFPPSTYPLESRGKQNPTLPNRLEPFREFTVIFHDEMAKVNAFQPFYDTFQDKPSNKIRNPLAHTLKAVGDVFMINYGSGGIGSEIIANRLGVGPMHDCLSCGAEEFFLTSHAVGDPAMVVDIPADFGLENCKPIAHEDGSPTTFENCGAIGPKATRAYYPDDPSNVHHSYINDHVKFRNLHTGKEHHIFHLHNHQWLYNPNNDNSNYLDAQAIGPGSGYTYEINFGGSGNRNKSAGDAIFHCHLYPHFAQGMWELWRNHDVFESGTPLQVSGSLAGFHTIPFALQDGMPAATTDDLGRPAHARALPDGEIRAGTPIPALVPLPTKAMAPMPGKVYVVDKKQTVQKKDPLNPEKTHSSEAAGSITRVDRTETDPSLVDQTATPLGNPINPTGLRNPGFPFWIAGMEHSVGQRAPTPPLDMMPKKDANGGWTAGGWDGGLPRHSLDGVAAARAANPISTRVVAVSSETRFDLSKRVKVAKPYWFPEDGTDLEKAAMAFHAVRNHPSFTVKLNGIVEKADFVTNGSKRPVAGAPFHDPCVDDRGKVLGNGVVGEFFDGQGGFRTSGSSPYNADHPRIYKGADIQFDAVLNKAGWHFPQERIIALWEDAVPIITKTKAPEPLVMRNNTFDCTMYLHTNLVPEVYMMDDFEVTTSTDIIGQHIHLPKWDLTTTDGSGNGWNYEDGTLAPGAVRERIDAINAFNSNPSKQELKNVEGGEVYTSENLLAHTSPLAANPILLPAKHPYFKDHEVNGQRWDGARTTLQRWFFDPVVNAEGVHRGLGIIFTHDHFGPSTHQQVGLYATVLVEPAGSTWVHNETGELLYDANKRKDGGPTSWQAVIKAGTNTDYIVEGKPAKKDLDRDNEDDSFREFYLEYSDFQHAYLPGTYVGADQNGSIGDENKARDEYKEYEPGYGHFKPPAQSRDAKSYLFAINPPLKADRGLDDPLDLVMYAGAEPNADNKCFQSASGVPEISRPCPEAITADDPGTMVVNYRNEPIGLRIWDTDKGKQADGPAGDLAFALQTFGKHRHLDDKSGKPAERAYRVANANFHSKDGTPLRGRLGVLNMQPREGDSINGTCFPKVLQAKCRGPSSRGQDSDLPSCQDLATLADLKSVECATDSVVRKDAAKSVAKPGDPFTPIMRAYYGDRIRLKVQAGGDEETHNVTVHGLKWLQGGSGFGFDPNSGWRNSQQAGISEQFSFAAPILPALNPLDKLENKGGHDATFKDVVGKFNPKLKDYLEKPRTVGMFEERSERKHSIDVRARELLGLLNNPSDEVLHKWALSLDEKDDSDEADRDEYEVQLHQKTDHLYSVDASTEGYWNGTWGVIRTYGNGLVKRDDLVPLPNNPQDKNRGASFDTSFTDVCPTEKTDNPDVVKPKVDRRFDVSAVLANDVLGNEVDAKSLNELVDKNQEHHKMEVFGLLTRDAKGNPAGTLVYNPRHTDIPDAQIPPDQAAGTEPRTIPGHQKGVLHDPTAIMYVMTRDLELKNPGSAPAGCLKNGQPNRKAFGSEACPAGNFKLKSKAPVEPVVLRAAAGECVEVTLRNLIGEKGAPDVLTYRQLAPIIPLHPDQPDGKVLNSNRVRTTSVVGLHPALVSYDVATNDGTAVGINDNSKTLADTVKNSIVPYRWYMGDISLVPDKPSPDKPRHFDLVRTPVEFGGINLMPADKIKQGQKGLVGALIVEPEHASWTGSECDRDPLADCDLTALDQVADHQQESTAAQRATRLSATVMHPDGHTPHFRDFVTVMQKGLTQLYGDGTPIEGIAAEEVVSEDTEDSGAFAINYGSEPLWFRFGKPASVPFTGMGSLQDIPNAHEAYSNALAGNADPAVPVLTAKAGQEFRMHVLEPAGTGRGSVFNLHGHQWERSPYICPGSSYMGHTNVCPKTGFFPTSPGFEVGSRAIGENPLAMYLGGQDSVLPAGHFDIVLPSAGGANAIPGDYLYKDQAGFGNLGGLWGIVRVTK